MGKYKFVTFVSLMICVLTIATASAAEPGSSGDPVVSKSYVDARISEIRSLINGNTNTNYNSNTNSNNLNSNMNYTATLDDTSKQKLIDEILSVVKALYDDKVDKIDQLDEIINSTSEDEDAFVPVELNKGQILIGAEGAEVIFRSGKATAYSENEMGLIDVSSGKELFNGDEISKNHLLIVGRNDGRGAKAVENSWFTVKGGFSIK